MKQIKVTIGQYDVLSRLSRELRTQKTLGVEHPVYCVYRRTRIYGINDEVTNLCEWNSPSLQLSFDNGSKEMEKFIADFKAKYFKVGITDEQILDCAGFVKLSYKATNVFVSFFFSEKGANDFIAANKDKYKDMYVFVDSAYGNPEIQALREVIMSIPDVNQG